MNIIDKSIHADQQKAISDQLAVFALELTFDAIPEKIRERSKYLMLDAIGIAYASQGFHFAGATMTAMTKSWGWRVSRDRLRPQAQPARRGACQRRVGARPGLRRYAFARHHPRHGFELAAGAGARRRVEDFRPRFSHCLCRGNGDVDAARIGRQRRLPSGRLSSDRPHRHFRLHARCFAAPWPQPRTDGNGAGRRLVHGRRQSRISERRRLDETHASGLGGFERDYSSNTGQARLRWTTRGLRGAIRPIRVPSRHAHGGCGPFACDQEISANRGRSTKSRSNRSRPATSLMHLPMRRSR